MNNKDHDVIVIVRIDGREYPTIIDSNGVQRFKANDVIRAIQLLLEPMGLNKLTYMYIKGEFSQEDYLDFYIMTGCSVNLIAEMSLFENLEIENPLWEKDDTQYVEMIRPLPQTACTPDVPVGTIGTIVSGPDYDPPSDRVAIKFDSEAVGYEVTDDDERDVVLYIPKTHFVVKYK